MHGDTEHLTLMQAAKLAPGRPSGNCIWRWCRRGVLARSGERIRLEHIGEQTVMRDASQLMSDQRSRSSSEGTRSPPNRESAIRSRHSALGAALITFAIVARSMNACRAGFVCGPQCVVHD